MVGSYVPWPSEDTMRRGKLAQIAIEGLPEPEMGKNTPAKSELDTEMDETSPEQSRPRRNPGRRATSVESRRRKMSEGGDPKPIALRERDKAEVDFGLDLFNPDEDM
jgi:hypothetical protein